jgi:hypothetical protein
MMHKSKRYKQRHRVVKKYTCKKHWQLDKLLDSFSNIEGLAIDNENPNSYSIYLNNAIAKLKPFLPFMIRYYEYKILPRERDYRSGFETYDYVSEYSILSNLEYISDRWQAAFRLRWLINLIDKDYTYKGKELTYDYDKVISDNKYGCWKSDITEAPIGKFVIVSLTDRVGFYVAKKRKDGTFVTKDVNTKCKVILSNVKEWLLPKHKMNSYYDR